MLAELALVLIALAAVILAAELGQQLRWFRNAVPLSSLKEAVNKEADEKTLKEVRNLPDTLRINPSSTENDRILR